MKKTENSDVLDPPGFKSQQKSTKEKKGKPSPKQFADETSEQVRARLLRKSEHMKNYRLMKKTSETPEEAAERRLKRKERSIQKMAGVIETPEQSAERRAKKRNYMHAKQAKETPEETEERRVKERAKKRKYLQKKRSNETPEEAAARRLKQRDYRRGHYQIEVDIETPEHAAERLAKKRNYVENKKANETPKQALERRLKERAKKRNYMQKMRANETPEKTAERLLKMREYRKRLSGNKLAKGTAKQAAPEGKRKTRQNQAASIATLTNVPIIKYENIDDEFDESCTWSSFATSEGSYSRTSIEGSLSNTSTAIRAQTMIQCKSDAPSEGKSEPSQDKGFFFEIVNSGPGCNEPIAAVIVQDIIVKEEVDL